MFGIGLLDKKILAINIPQDELYDRERIQWWMSTRVRAYIILLFASVYICCIFSLPHHHHHHYHVSVVYVALMLL